MTRRTILTLALLAAGAGTSRAQLAQGLNKFLGNVYSTSQVQDFTEYWNQVTPENASKWGSVEPIRDTMRWSELDAAYALAKDNGFPFHFHVLIWGNQQPGWIESLPAAEQLEEIEEWFAAVAERYPDIDFLEVVNEPLHDPPDGPGDGNYIEALGGASGWTWVLNAFRMARTQFPNARLMINDYNIVNSASNTGRYVELVELLQAEDLIDIIGVQGHAFSTRGTTAATMQANLDALAATGLPIQVTELDIDSGTDSSNLSQKDQWDEYKRVFPVLWEHPAVEGITLWGWRPGLWRNQQGAYLINPDGTERAAMTYFLKQYFTNLQDVEPATEQPADFRLLGNYPNPFNPQTTIGYELERPASVTLGVYDPTGALVRTLVDGHRAAAAHRVEWDGRDALGRAVPSGVYLYRLTTPSGTATRPMVLIK